MDEEMALKKGFAVPDEPASDDPVDRMVYALMVQTRAFAQVNKYWAAPKEKEEEPKDAAEVKRLQEISDLVKKLGGCNESDFRKLITLVVGKSLPSPKVQATDILGVQFVPFALAKVKDNPNSHNYPKHTPILIHRVESEKKRAHGMIDQGLEGNWLPEYPKSYEPCTKEEIETFVKNLKKNKTGSGVFAKYASQAFDAISA
jgi:hypothetical protein